MIKLINSIKLISFIVKIIIILFINIEIFTLSLIILLESSNYFRIIKLKILEIKNILLYKSTFNKLIYL